MTQTSLESGETVASRLEDLPAQNGMKKYCPTDESITIE